MEHTDGEEVKTEELLGNEFTNEVSNPKPKDWSKKGINKVHSFVGPSKLLQDAGNFSGVPKHSDYHFNLKKNTLKTYDASPASYTLP